jgi:hypothetical protein
MRSATVTRPDARPRAAAILLIVALITGCGPGTGGTGLPPASAGAPTGDAVAAPPASGPTTRPPAAGSPSGPAIGPTAAAPVTVPDRPPDRVGTVESIDETTLRIAGLDIARARVDVLLADGRPATVDALRTGAEVLAWEVGSQIVVQLRP